MQLTVKKFPYNGTENCLCCLSVPAGTNNRCDLRPILLDRADATDRTKKSPLVLAVYLTSASYALETTVRLT